MAGLEFMQWSKPSTEQDITERIHKAHEYSECKNGSNGNYGKMIELLLTSNTANHCKTEVSPAGLPDFYITDEYNGVAIQRLTECKTNGGAIDCLFTLTEQERKECFFVYYYHMCNKNTNYEPWEVQPLIFTYQDFLDLLESVGAVRLPDKTSNPTAKIQAATRKFYNALLNCKHGIPYYINHNYTIIDGHAVDYTVTI